MNNEIDSDYGYCILYVYLAPSCSIHFCCDFTELFDLTTYCKIKVLLMEICEDGLIYH